MTEGSPKPYEGEQGEFEHKPLSEVQQKRDQTLLTLITREVFKASENPDKSEQWVQNAIHRGYEIGSEFWQGTLSQVTRDAIEQTTIPMPIGMHPEVKKAFEEVLPQMEPALRKMSTD